MWFGVHLTRKRGGLWSAQAEPQREVASRGSRRVIVNPEHKKTSSQPVMDKRPMASVRRVNLFRREIRERLSLPALEILLARARAISEGKLTQKKKGPVKQRYYGSTMLTLELQEAREHIRDPLDAASALKLKEMLREDRRFTNRLREIVQKEAERIAGCSLERVDMEMRLDAEGNRILVDLDLEAATLERSKPRQMVIKTKH